MGHGGVGFLGLKQHEMLPVFLVELFLGFCLRDVDFSGPISCDIAILSL